MGAILGIYTAVYIVAIQNIAHNRSFYISETKEEAKSEEEKEKMINRIGVKLGLKIMDP